mgnify:FL=1
MCVGDVTRVCVCALGVTRVFVCGLTLVCATWDTCHMCVCPGGDTCVCALLRVCGLTRLCVCPVVCVPWV